MDNVNKPVSVAATVAVCIAVITLFVLLGELAWWLWATGRSTEWETLRSLIIVGFIVWSMALSLLVLGFIAFRLLIKDRIRLLTLRKHRAVTLTEHETIYVILKKYLRSRYNLFWRCKVRLLLITGDEEAIEQLFPGLQSHLWLESNCIVLIYGGSLATVPDREKYAALRRLRSWRPLDGIIRVISPTASLMPEISDNDLRGLETLSKLLRYSAPVWLWQLCNSDWSQDKRTEQVLGVTFPRHVTTADITRQFEQILPVLRTQGMSQVAEDNRHDFLLRLGRELKEGGIARWTQQLAPWQESSRRHISLRGVIFSLPKNKASDISGEPVPSLFSDTDKFVPESQRHTLFPSVSLQGIIDDCTRVHGHRMGFPREQMFTVGIMAVAGIWGAGLLLSFALNYGQISVVAEKARALMEHPSVSDYQLMALHELRNDAGRLQHYVQEGSPWYLRFGLDHNRQLLDAMLPWYGVANNRLIRDPASEALVQKLQALVGTPPDSELRAHLAKSGYEHLKAWLMMAHPDKSDGAYYVQVMKNVQPERTGISTALWQSLSPDLWGFYITGLSAQPQWRITPDTLLLSQSRQVLLQQTGLRNAESTLYENMLKSVRRNFADVSLEDITGGTDARRLFTTNEVIPGMFTRQAWEGEVQQAIEKIAGARRDEIDWVLSDSRMTISADFSPEILKARLTRRYFTDFAGSWLNFLNSLRWNPTNNITDVIDQLTLMSDVRQSPLIALINNVAWQAQAGQQSEALSASVIRSAKELISGRDNPIIDQSVSGPQGPLDDTFGSLLMLAGKHKSSNMMSVDNSLSLQTWLTRVTRVRLRLQQMASAQDPQAMMQQLAQSVFRGKSVELNDTREYGSLLAASLGEEWNGFGQAMFVQPLSQAWQTVLQPSAISLNERWQRAVVADWRMAFDGRFPFAASRSDASLPMLAEFIRKDSGRIDRFLATELSGVLHKEGSQWIPESAHSQGLTFDPAFIRAINQLSQLSDILFTDGSQGINFELQARPVPQVVETQLTIDGQKLHYFNQMAGWQSFRWPGDTWKPGTMLTWKSASAGTRLFGDYTGTWGFIRWLEQGKRRQLDRSQWMMSFTAPDGRILQWVLRTQLGNGPLALLTLRGFRLPDQIFSVEPTVTSQAVMGGAGNGE